MQSGLVTAVTIERPLALLHLWHFLFLLFFVAPDLQFVDLLYMLWYYLIH